ncbi:hypothetical protein Poli38472_008676 [Pythium oligandrum]|uniref:RING-type domain-containing protein n=1 Tax=Pythium oligandrum TaxID=41045 RepID=A0A8K1C408_PYTOL|nr:hypothetical protein Poli38472_008676 [Pythium oligandrum]|eukprot:TMW56028.1 hypothetical protein Poli38472_008676 [Pythium oligandrum]
MTENQSSTTPQATTQGAQPRIAFMMPAPVTVWLQFSDGTQMGISPSPSSSVMGIPLSMMMPGTFGLFGGLERQVQEEGMMRAIHELFMRTQNEQHGPPPTSTSFLEKIPLKTWTAKSTETEKYKDCPICLCEYELNEEVLPLPCGHLFHKECGMKWLVEHNVCPTCRYELPKQAEATPAVPAPVATTDAATSTSDEPDAEPDAEAEPEPRSSRVRQRPVDVDHARVVRRRVSEGDVVTLPGSMPSMDEDELDNMLEEEATRLVAEEAAKQFAAEVNFDDEDVADLLRDTSS